MGGGLEAVGAFQRRRRSAHLNQIHSQLGLGGAKADQSAGRGPIAVTRTFDGLWRSQVHEVAWIHLQPSSMHRRHDHRRPQLSAPEPGCAARAAMALEYPAGRRGRDPPAPPAPEAPRPSWRHLPTALECCVLRPANPCEPLCGF